MEDILIYCAGGQGRHIALLVQQIGGYNLLGFIDENPALVGQNVGGHRVYGSIEEALGEKTKVCIALANGKPRNNYRIVKKLKSNGKYHFKFPNLIHPSVIYDKEGVEFGEGNIINVGANLTTDIKIGSYNYFNRGTLLGHDTTIGNYCLISSGVIVGGNVRIGDCCFLGMGTKIIQGKTIGKNVLTGAGSIIQTDVPDNAVMIMPRAKIFKYQEPIQD
jgi:sugar O-acyltransferase (sialic acid O-acetyltransferase NeuD family)